MSTTSYAKEKLKILLLEGVHAAALEAFRADGYTQIEYYEKSLPHSELLEKVADAYFMGVRSTTHLTSEVLKCAKRLVAIGCFCIGTDQVDLLTAQLKGIPVFNAPYSNTRSVAELVLAEIILLMRNIPEKNAAAHAGKWLKSAAHCYEIRGKILGIVGYGHIGTQLGILAENLGMQIYYYDIEQKLALGNAKAVGSLNELLAIADVLSLHVPETALTKNMLSAAQFAAMKPNSYFINASRGKVVNIDDLAQALVSQHIRGAAIDVFPQEPKSLEEAFSSPLQKFDNVLLTPHIGGSTLEAQHNIAEEVAKKLIKYSNNGSTMMAVNFPEVALPAHPNKCRLLHIHKNVPGILSKINEIFSIHNINVAGQYLQTNENIGYVVIDIDTHSSTLALEKLREITGTIRTRLLY